MKKIIRIVVIIILLAAAGFAVAVIVQKNKDKKNKTTEQVPVVIQDPGVGQPSQNTGNPASSLGSTPTPTQSAPTPVGNVPPASDPAPVSDAPPVVVPAPKPTPSSMVTFKSSTGLHITIPAAWHPQEELKNGTTYTVFYNANNEVTASVEAYQNSGNTLDLIEQQLAASPSVTNIRRLTVAGCPALQYNIAQGVMVVFVRNASTYYISGQLAIDASRLSF